MVRCADIVEHIRGLQEAKCVHAPHLENPEAEVLGVRPDHEAREGDMAWMSPKQAQLYPERVETFQGTLLVCPSTLDKRLWQKDFIVVCERPKLVFIRVVEKFFSHLLNMDWPSPSGPPIWESSIVEKSVKLSYGVVVGSGVCIEKNVTIGPNTVLANCTVKKGVTIGANCTIGLAGFGFEKDEEGRYWRFPHMGKVIIEELVEIGSNTCIDRGSLGNTIIGRGSKLGNLVHVAHNVVIGPNSLVINNSTLCGSANLGENVWVAPSVTVMNHIAVGHSSILGMGAVVIRDVSPGAVVVGNPAREMKKGGSW